MARWVSIGLISLMLTLGFPWLEGNGIADGPDPMQTNGIIDSADPIGVYIIIDDGSPFTTEDPEPFNNRDRLWSVARDGLR